MLEERKKRKELSKNKISIKKSKSINHRNISNNRLKTKKLTIFAKSYNTNIINDNKENFQKINKNKNESNLIIDHSISRIGIYSNKCLNIKNIKGNSINQASIKSLQINKFINNENKENILNGNIIINPETYCNFYNKNKKNKYLNGKKNNKKSKKNKLNKINRKGINENMNKKLNLNIKRKKEKNIQKIRISKKDNEIKEDKKININALNNQGNKNDNIKKDGEISVIKDNINTDLIRTENNKINLNNNLDNIIKRISIFDNKINDNKNKIEDIRNKMIEKEESENQKANISIQKENNIEIPILKLEEEKNEESIKEKEKSKRKTPILKLDSVSSSTSKNNKNSKNASYIQEIITNSDYSESSYETEGLEIKGKLLKKNKKTDFLNNIKKCLFNKTINLENSLNDFNSNPNSKSKTNIEEDFKFKNSKFLQKKE